MNKNSRSKTKRTTRRSVLRLPDLEHAKTAVSPHSRDVVGSSSICAATLAEESARHAS
jgi:hypothetical protein